MIALKSLLIGGLRRFGRELVSTEAFLALERRSNELGNGKPLLREYEFLRSLPPQAGAEAFKLLQLSRSQFRQDLFVLSETGFRNGGYFVEFGATNGIDLSNTWLLEKHFGWTGILAEPAHVWHEDLRKNRACAIENRCVWTETGKMLQFAEVASADLSTISDFAAGDMHGSHRRDQKSYAVETISLLDLLRAHAAPHDIDYLSIDTEGSELDILAAFDFDAYRIGLITVEHNFTLARERIRMLLESHGYVRRMAHVSHVDDWYVLPAR